MMKTDIFKKTGCLALAAAMLLNLAPVKCVKAEEITKVYESTAKSLETKAEIGADFSSTKKNM